MALALVLGALAAAIPAYRVTKLNVTDALRRVG
jgi:ABC-type antimicrobial peptide transport system permease subunit